MRRHRNTPIKGLLLLLTTLLYGCDVLHDDMSQCDLFLKFRYDYNMSYQDWFGDQVEEVKVFVFNPKNEFVSTFHETAPALGASGYSMPVPYHLKGYKIVVWAGKTADDYKLPDLKQGDTLDELILRYETENNQSNRPIASLWHSGPDELTFPEEGGNTQTVSLIRNTNDFSIDIADDSGGFKVITDFDISITSANGAYDYRNTLPAGLPEIKYIPNRYSEQQSAHLHLLRLIKGNKSILSITEKSSNKVIEFDGEQAIDLIGLLLKMKDEQEIVKMDDQEYLDRKYSWDITLKYDADTYLATSITVNGWTYWFHNTDLG